MEAIMTEKNYPPGPQGLLQLTKWGLAIRNTPLETYTRLHQTYGDMAYCPWPNNKCVFVWHPDLVGYVLKENHTNYHKTKQYDQLLPMLGQGLLTSNGELWRHQRKLMAKQFHGSSIDTYSPSIKRLIDEAIVSMKDGTHDVELFFSGLTMRIAGEIFFGANVESFVDTIGKGLASETELVNKRIRSMWSPPMWVPTPENIRRKATIAKMDRVVEKIMQEDRAGRPENILSKLLADGDSTRRQIRDEVMTLLLAGHETTSNNLMWTTWLLALHPEWQGALLEELKAGGKKALDISRADLPQYKVLRAVINESLRLMPPAPVFARNTIEDDEIGGFYVPKDTTIVCQPYVTQRDEQFWPEPLSFRPQRFFNRPERKDDYTFFPFARGPRSCIGEEMAMVESSLILAAFVEAFDWRLKEGFEPKPAHNLTLQSTNGMWLELTRRSTPS